MAIALEGAEACRAMLRAISALKFVQLEPDRDVEDDDGLRRDYGACDHLLMEAIEQHWSNPGFRLALGAYLLGATEGEGRFLDQRTAEWMLTDGGYRGKRELTEALGGAQPRRQALPPVEKIQKPREGKRAAKREPVAEAA